MRRAVIFGATGLVGGYLVRELVVHPYYEQVTLIGRTPFRKRYDKMKQIQVDSISDSTLAEIDPGPIDTVFCALGTTLKKAGSKEAFEQVDLHAVLAAARWGKARGARNFLVVSAMGADPHSKLFYNRTKGRMEAELKKIGYTSLNIFQPSLLLGHRLESRPLERFGQVLLSALSPLARLISKDLPAVHARVVAHAMVRAAYPPVPGAHTHTSHQIEVHGRY